MPPKCKKRGAKIYCGDKALPEGYAKLGTRFRCLQMGFGVGTMIERKELKKGKTKTKINDNYQPKSMYCGNKTQAQRGGDGKPKGTRNQCLKRGVGAGIYSEHRKYVADKNYFRNLEEDEAKRIPYCDEREHKSGGEEDEIEKNNEDEDIQNLVLQQGNIDENRFERYTELMNSLNVENRMRKYHRR